MKEITIYTDGACRGNPGPGGYAAVLIHDGRRKEMSGGWSNTTNNRMEMMAAIVGLGVLKERCQVTLFSDSQYLVQSITQGWAVRWQANGWKRNKKEIAKNIDLWQQLLELCDKHDVAFKWTKGHAGDPENERCDELATTAADSSNLEEDPANTGSGATQARLF